MFEGVDSKESVFEEGYREVNASKVSLQDRLQNMQGQPFSLEEAFTVLAQLGQALSYAHQCNVTHGNLNPYNILLNDKGHILLDDFFLHALAQQPDDRTTPEASAYRAPELPPGQASKEGDQYALGYIAYEMLTGHKPFLVASVSKPGTFYRTKMPIPPKHFNPALSLLREEAIFKAIAKEPAQRHRDISSFLTALGIPTDTKNPAASMEAVAFPLVSDLPEQVDLLKAPVEYPIEKVEKFPPLDTPPSTLTVQPNQISRPFEAEDTAPMSAIKLQSADYHSPDQYSFTRNLFADTIATDPQVIAHTSTHVGTLGTNNAKRFFKWRWIGAVITCLIVIGIVATSSFA